MNLAHDLARSLEPGSVMVEAGLAPDKWQSGLIESESKRHLLLCSRQSGKSTVVAALGCTMAIADPGLQLLVSPSERQSVELFRKAKDIYLALDGVPRITQESTKSMELENGSRIVALPGTEATLRGYSAPRLIAIDEAARVPDDLFSALMPMLAISQGRLVAMTTPAGRRGWFYNAWVDGGKSWERILVTAKACPRLTKRWLKEQEALLGPFEFKQEYFCEFVDTDEQYFSSKLIEACFSKEVAPLWA